MPAEPADSAGPADTAGPADIAGSVTPRTGAVDAIVLAGGTGRRLGGASKPDVVLAGERLLDRVLAAVAARRRICVVAPESVRLPAGVLRTLEDPPHGGPVAGISAGLAALAAAAGSPDAAGSGTGFGGSGFADSDGGSADADGGSADRMTDAVLVLACDMPGAAQAVPALLGALQGAGDADGAIAVRPDGHRENLAFIARPDAIRAALDSGGDRDRSVRSLLAQLDLVDAVLPAAALDDVDTWEQHAAWEARLSGDPDAARSTAPSLPADRRSSADPLSSPDQPASSEGDPS